MWPFYKWLPSLTRLPSSTVRDMKRITLSYPLAITWWTPPLNRWPKKRTPPRPFFQFTQLQRETELLKPQGASQYQGYWFLNNTLVLLEQQIKPTLTALHQVFHSNPLSLLHLIKTHITLNPCFHKTLKEISFSCLICSKTNPLSSFWHPSFPTHQARSHMVQSLWQVDVTNRSLVRHTRYLLVFIDTRQDGSKLSPLLTKKPLQ
jgi:hypothetical protein